MKTLRNLSFACLVIVLALVKSAHARSEEACDHVTVGSPGTWPHTLAGGLAASYWGASVDCSVACGTYGGGCKSTGGRETTLDTTVNNSTAISAEVLCYCGPSEM